MSKTLLSKKSIKYLNELSEKLKNKPESERIHCGKPITNNLRKSKDDKNQNENKKI